MPGGWEDVLAAVGGAAAGYSGERDRRDKDALEEKKLAQAREIAQMRSDVSALIEQVKQDHMDARYLTPSGNVTAQQAGANDRAGQSNATTQRGQDLNFDLGTARNATTQRGQDITATTQRRGQDVTSSTARRGQDLGDTHYWDSSNRLYEGMILGDRRARTRDAVDAYGHAVTAGRSNNLGLDDTKPVPPFNDWLKGNQSIFGPMTPDAPLPPARGPATTTPGAGGPPLTVPATAPPAASAAAGARPPAPIPARGAAPAASKYQVGQTVKLKNGQTVTIKSINPDGTFSY